MRVRVEAYAGFRADERPLRFFVGDLDFPVERVISEWRTPLGSYFRVESRGEQFLLHLDAATGEWTLPEENP